MIDKFSYITNSSDESIKLGKNISKLLRSGDIIGLNGDLGSGKTTFIKGVLQGLNYKEKCDIPNIYINQ